jgi:energy-coupling factor transport system permease protein
VVVQAILGSHPEVEVIRNTTIDSGPAWIALRLLQVSALIIASLMATARTGSVELASALAWFTAPLRILRVPVESVALALALSLSLVPAMTADLERLRQAQVARGIDPRAFGPRVRLRLKALLIAPLVVLAFRRAYLVAEAMHVRGWNANVRRTHWRPVSRPLLDLAVLALAMAMCGTIVIAL